MINSLPLLQGNTNIVSSQPSSSKSVDTQQSSLLRPQITRVDSFPERAGRATQAGDGSGAFLDGNSGGSAPVHSDTSPQNDPDFTLPGSGKRSEGFTAELKDVLKRSKRVVDSLGGSLLANDANSRPPDSNTPIGGSRSRKPIINNILKIFSLMRPQVLLKQRFQQLKPESGNKVPHHHYKQPEQQLGQQQPGKGIHS